MGEQRRVLILLLILCFTVVSISQIEMVKTEPKTIVVPEDYPTIQAAIDDASEGDTVFIKKGTYNFPINQTLVINKTISLIGEDAENTIINLHPSWVFKGWEGPTPMYGYDYPIKIEANDVHISGFTITTVGGFRLLKVSGIGSQITGNYLETGLILEYSRQNITGNIVRGNILCIGHYHTIANNIIGGNIWSTAIGVLIEGNMISDEDTAGIGIGGYNNTIFNNTVENCNIGISFWGSASKNLIYNNNFINNTIQVKHKIENASVGKWDNGYVLGGNYWSDYQGLDNNADGIGDTPYIIDENNQDNYPLMEPFVLPKFQSTMMSFDEAIDAVSLGKSNPCSGGFGMTGELEQAAFVDERGITGFLAWLAPNGTIYQVEYPSERVLGKIGEYLDGYLPPPHDIIFWWLNYESGLQHLVDVSDGSIIWSRPIIIGPTEAPPPPTSEPPPNDTSAIANPILHVIIPIILIVAVATVSVLMIKRKKLKKN